MDEDLKVEKTKRVMFALSGVDTKEKVHLENVMLTSYSGTITSEDINNVKAQHCKRLRCKGIKMYPHKCMVLGMFEIDF